MTKWLPLLALFLTTGTTRAAAAKVADKTHVMFPINLIRSTDVRPLSNHPNLLLRIKCLYTKETKFIWVNTQWTIGYLTTALINRWPHLQAKTENDPEITFYRCGKFFEHDEVLHDVLKYYTPDRDCPPLTLLSNLPLTEFPSIIEIVSQGSPRGTHQTAIPWMSNVEKLVNIVRATPPRTASTTIFPNKSSRETTKTIVTAQFLAMSHYAAFRAKWQQRTLRTKRRDRDADILPPHNQ